MNKVLLVGRIVKDIEVKNTASQVPVCSFTIAVDRKFKNQNGERESDFINCVAWRQTANFIGSYFHKGSRIGLVGSIQTRTYEDNNGNKRYVTEVVVDDAEFVESANQSAPSKPKNVKPSYQQEATDDGYVWEDDPNDTIAF